MPGGISFGAGGTLYATLTALPPNVNCSEGWGHPACEVAYLRFPDSENTSLGGLITQPDRSQPRWLPNIQRPTGHDTVQTPALIYTSGIPGENNCQTLSNRVYFWTF